VTSRSNRRSTRFPVRTGRGGSNQPAPSIASIAERLPFLIAIAVSSFLLFSLELWAGRKVLPVYGGTPGVWETTLCFFTAVLFVGYLYAHVVATRLSPMAGGFLQLGIAIVAAALTVIAPNDVASLRVDGWPEVANVLLAVAVIGGPAGFLLASTTPLLSAWYAGRGNDPWWLYAVSNAASFVALIAYAFYIQSVLGLVAQRVAMVFALILYVSAIGLVAHGAFLRRKNPPIAIAAEAEASPEPAPARRRQLLWLIAAASTAGLMAATTNVLQIDLFAAPHVWVGPLAVYLASFVVAFSARGRRLVPMAQRLAPVAATLMWIPYVQPNNGWPPLAIFVVELVALLLVCVAVHGRLAEDRPPTAGLTRFYLVVSAGGVLATAFVALLAPVIFPDLWEYPILIVAELATLALFEGRAGRWLPDFRTGGRRQGVDLVVRLLPYAVAAVPLYLLTASSSNAGSIAAAFVIGLVVVGVSLNPRLATVVAPIAIVVAIFAVTPGQDKARTLDLERSFFGVIKVQDSGPAHLEYSGTTLHGIQFTDNRSRIPTSYFAASGPLGAVFSDLRARTNGAAIGDVGLGVGTIAAYAQKGDQLTFYEIDPAVVRIAYDPTYFTFLRDSAVVPHVVVGDGRLSIEAAAPASFDVLLLDAFQSDSVPVHLLTREAMLSYVRVLRPDGVIAFNVSNRFYRLAPGLAATARSLGLDAVGTVYTPDAAASQSQAALESVYVVIGSDAVVSRFQAVGWMRVPDGGPVQTDDFPGLFRSLQLFGN
jgi:SAM-dependent methyltransferase